MGGWGEGPQAKAKSGYNLIHVYYLNSGQDAPKYSRSPVFRESHSENEMCYFFVIKEIHPYY